MAEGGGQEIIAIGLAFDTSKLLQGTQQVTAALNAIDASTKQAQAAFAALEQKLTVANQGLAAVAAAVTQVTQAERQGAQATEALAAAVTKQTAAATQASQAEKAGAQATLALADAIKQQTAAYTQAQAATLAYKQQQDQLRESLRQQRDAQAAANAEAGKAGAAWQGALSVAGGIGIAVSIGAITAALVTSGKASVEAAVKHQSLIATFAAIEGSASKGQAALAFLRNEANRIGVDFVNTATAFKGLDAAARGTTLEGGKTREIFVAISEASRVLGLSGTETSRILTAISQIMSKGKVSAEELRQQIGESLPGAFGLAARAMGVTTAELDKMLQSGKLMAEDFLPKFAAQIRREFGPGLTSAADTAAATFARLGNEVQAMSAKVGNQILVLLNPLAKFAKDVLADVRKVDEAAGRARGRAGAEAIAGKPVFGGTQTEMELAAGFTSQEATRGTQIVQQIVDASSLLAGLRTQGRQMGQATQEKIITDLQVEFKTLNDTIKARTEYNKQREQSDDIARGAAGQAIKDAEAKRKKDIEEIATLEKQLPVELEKAALRAKTFASQFETLPEKLKAVETIIEEVNKKLEEKPGLRGLPAVQGFTTRLDTLAKGFEGQIEAGKAAEKAKEKAARDAEQASENAARDAEAYEKRLEREEAAADHASRGARAAKLAEGEQIIVQLERMAAAYTKPKEARDLDTASALAASEVLNKEQAGRAGVALATIQQGVALKELKAAIEEEMKPALERAKAYDAATKALARYQEQLGLSGGGKITAEARAVSRAEKEFLALRGTDQEAAADAVVVDLRQQAREATPAFKRLTRASESVADFFQDTLSGLATGSIRGSGSEAVASAKARLADTRARLGEADRDVVGASDPRSRYEAAGHAQRLRQEYIALTHAVKEAEAAQESAFQKIAKSFQKMVLDVTMEALNLKEVLGKGLRDTAGQAVDWLQVVLGIGKAVAGVGTTGPLQGPTQSGATLDVATSGRARGGPVYSNTPYLVGERGKTEIFVPSQDGRILSHADAMVALGSVSPANRDAAPGYARAMATGGPAFSDTPYVVGEGGKAEVFVPAHDGRILSHEDAMAATGSRGGKGQTVINVGGVHVHGVQDMASFQRSRGQLDKGITQMIQNALRAS